MKMRASRERLACFCLTAFVGQDRAVKLCCTNSRLDPINDSIALMSCKDFSSHTLPLDLNVATAFIQASHH